MSVEVGTGIRNVCDVGLRQIPLEPDRELEPGDIILAKSAGSRLSELIAKFDGWWTHAAISLGGDRVAHSNPDGVTEDSLTQFKQRYPDGLAVARPNLDPNVRTAAAEWADSVADNPLNPFDEAWVTEYDAGDLGVAFSLLWRASRQPGIEELRKIRDSTRESFGGPDKAPVLKSTCSGFVFRCYSEGAATLLEINPAPGIRVEDGKLVVPNKDALLDELREDVREESLGLDIDRLRKWQKMLGIGVEGVATAVAASIARKPVPLAIGVTPMDLWISPSHGSVPSNRWFIRGLDQALVATAGCGSD